MGRNIFFRGVSKNLSAFFPPGSAQVGGPKAAPFGPLDFLQVGGPFREVGGRGLPWLYGNSSTGQRVKSRESGRQTVNQWRAEGLGCPGPTRFLDAHQLKKIFIRFNFFSHFSQFLLFLSEHLSGCPLYAFTLTFSTFTYAFSQKTPSLDAPRLDARGWRTPTPPLHAGRLW